MEKQTVGTFDYAAHALAQYDAQQIVDSLTSRVDAQAQLTKAQRDGNAMLVNALKQKIAERWPIKRQNLSTLLNTNNDKMTSILVEWVADPGIQTAIDNFRKGNITLAFRDAEINSILASKPWKATLEKIASDADKLVETATMELQSGLNDLTTTYGNTNDRLLAEMRDGKAWERYRRELDALDPLKAVTKVQSDVREADSELLRVILLEAPSYLTSRGITDAGANITKVVIENHPHIATLEKLETYADTYRAAIKFNVNWVLGKLTAAPTKTAIEIQREAIQTLITPAKLGLDSIGSAVGVQ